MNSSGLLSWLATSFIESSPTFCVSETGFTMKLGALKTVIGPWGLYIPAGDSEEPEQPTEPEEPVVEGVQLELETSVEGKPFILNLHANGTLRTGWTNYAQTMQEGTWSVVDGALVLTMGYESTITENAEGGLDITVNYGQMGEKVYTLTADQAAAILN